MLLTYTSAIALLLTSGTLLAQPAAGNLREVVSVTVSAATSSDTGPVHVVKVKLVDDDLRLEVQNDSELPVIALSLEYQNAGCDIGEDLWSLGSAGDGSIEPGMRSITIPAHGHAWYRDQAQAGRLAFAALKTRTRYVESIVQVSSYKLLEGTVKLLNRDRSPHQGANLKSGVCTQWAWDDQLAYVTSTRFGGKQSASSGSSEKQVRYTCGLVDGILTCPE